MPDQLGAWCDHLQDHHRRCSSRPRAISPAVLVLVILSAGPRSERRCHLVPGLSSIRIRTAACRTIAAVHKSEDWGEIFDVTLNNKAKTGHVLKALSLIRPIRLRTSLTGQVTSECSSSFGTLTHDRLNTAKSSYRIRQPFQSFSLYLSRIVIGRLQFLHPEHTYPGTSDTPAGGNLPGRLRPVFFNRLFCFVFFCFHLLCLCRAMRS